MSKNDELNEPHKSDIGVNEIGYQFRPKNSSRSCKAYENTFIYACF